VRSVNNTIIIRYTDYCRFWAHGAACVALNRRFLLIVRKTQRTECAQSHGPSKSIVWLIAIIFLEPKKYIKLYIILLILVLLLMFVGHQYYPVTYPILQPLLTPTRVFQSNPPVSTSTYFIITSFHLNRGLLSCLYSFPNIGSSP